MTKVTIVPENPGASDTLFRASTRERASVGSTPGAALDALTKQLDKSELGTYVIVQNLQPDGFFTAAQQERLGELMSKWRVARDADRELDATEQAELERLIDAEFEGSANRAEAIAKELRS